MRAFSVHGQEVAAPAGLYALVRQPIDPEGHFAAQNGHRT
jgi:hypothetical protein